MIVTETFKPERKMAGGLGFEPRYPDPESGVLPLDDPPPTVFMSIRDILDGNLFLLP